ncbi:EAL and HDOD domain-containing protein [Aquabacterium sp. OR-4]|uniref:EAL and HDOD domain-containing protein n=1 Tax=Aquabacterium sp. OR-4 TaxID=2978127 RepID=UPI0021B1AC20|nr:HDOD domain-containing protein [Aquabacterium sp. OR-4]MDT7836184.1 HDOD domain-containing protein [Aquabacterium sp. OR-4]
MTEQTNEHRVLGQVALGYSPMIDRHRAITALRLTVSPVLPEARPEAADLLALLADTWPAEAGRLSLNIASEALLGELLSSALPPHLMLELPAFIAADPAHSQALAALYKNGNTLLIKGRPLAPLPREVLPCFAYSIIDLADERRDGLPPPGGVSRTIPHVQSGVRTLTEMNDAFGRGAIAVLGWPIDDPAVASGARPSQARPELQAIVELINRVDRGEAIERLEAVMKNDPTMAYKLLRYINSPAFGLSVEISSFRHAIMMLGYQRLKRWLALLLASGGRDANLKPVIYAAVRRGLLMEELARDAGSDDEQRGDLFICGVFSLLDRLMQQPFDTLLNSVPTSDNVRAALVQGSGPHHPYLELVRAVESASVYDIRSAAEGLMISVGTVNRAVLRALAAARQLD